MRRKSVLSGSDGAMSGAVIAMTPMSRPTRPPATERGLRRANDASSRATERPGRRGRAATARTATSVVTDAGVEPGVAQVDRDVDDDEDDGVEQDQILHDNGVALDDRDDERAAEPGHAERLLDRDRPAEDEPYQDPGERDDGQERVRQRVAHDDERLSDPLGTRRADVVLQDDLEQAGARHAGDVGALAETQHD